MQIPKDEALKGNEKIEEYIEMLQKEPSDEILAVLLTAIRRRMKEGGQMVVGVEAAVGNQFQVKVLSLKNGQKWFCAFTSFEEEIKGRSQVMSTFMADIGQLLEMALNEPSVEGLMINPWGKVLMLNKNLIQVIKG